VRKNRSAGAGQRTGDAGPIAGGRAAGKPPRWWFVAVPCLLALPVAGWGLLFSALFGIYSCFDTCRQHTPWLASPAGTRTIAIAELIAGAVALASLKVGLAKPKARRALALAGWAAFLLACAGVALLYVASYQ